MVAIFFTMLLAACVCVSAHAKPAYYVGEVGQNCIETCHRLGMNCNAAIHTHNSSSFFAQVGVNCTTFDTQPWWASDQPSIDTTDGKCVGYLNVPQAVACQGYFPTTKRVCRCDPPRRAKDPSAFGTGLSQGLIDAYELPVFAHTVSPGAYGVMTHFWMTPTGANVTVRYYVDGEANASIAFQPQVACGVGFDDDSSPWGTRWFGKGAKTGGWFWNFRVPFLRSIKVTVQSLLPNVLYIILRGAPNIPIQIGGVNVPVAAGTRLVQQVFQATVPALAFVPVLDIPTGPGIFFMQTLTFEAPNLNTLEGCYHMFTPHDEAWPGTLLSTGTEDYYDSAYYFNAGEFHLPVSGFTHLGKSPRGNVTLSAYRFHDEDPIAFDARGIRIHWRNGDMTDASGVKCLIESGGTPNGSPQAADVLIYAWAYVWADSD